MEDTHISRAEEEELPVAIVYCGEIFRDDQALEKSKDQENGLSKGIDQDITTERFEVKIATVLGVKIHVLTPLVL
ncbi:hypothetical protein [Methanofollis ethanolicus]|uniref:hypothetical protein n=1 Tax=Methanofollis ethanolicus TaxID=488124 RepID=UPI001F31DDC3|nr:hypothetical protein [Methanofollis ethanolicus]